jgi:signal recognition particle subunit SRP68
MSRALSLSQTYEPHHKYAEAISLTQRAQLHLRETHTNLTDTSNPDTPETSFYPLASASAQTLEQDVQRAELDLKKRWFAHNGGKVVEGSHQKPLFFDAVLNYVDLPMEKLQEKAGIAPAAAKTSPVVEKKTLVERKVDAERNEPPASTAAQQESQGMLGSLLGGWWGRK